jgi:hypothetical protein
VGFRVGVDVSEQTQENLEYRLKIKYCNITDETFLKSFKNKLVKKNKYLRLREVSSQNNSKYF